MPGDQKVNRLPRDYGSRSNRAGHHPNPTGSSCNLFSRRRTTGSVSHRKRNHLCARVAGKGLRNRMCQTKVVDRQFLSYASEQADRTWHQAIRHLEVCEFYVQGAIQAKLLSLAKVKGTVNCANFLTKHPKSGTEVRAALPSLGMYEEREEGEMLSEAQRINVKVRKVGNKHKWKPPIPARPNSRVWSRVLPHRLQSTAAAL